MRLNSDIIARANKMKLIMQFGVGLEGILSSFSSFLYPTATIFICSRVFLHHVGVDIDAATKHGIRVARIPSNYTGNAISCAEMAIYLMLGLLRKQVGHFNLKLSTELFLFIIKLTTEM